MANSWRTIGFDKNKRLFEHAIEGGGLAHAYLFSGPEMMGKKTFALEIADKLTLGNAQDTLVITAAGSDSGQTIAIDDVRKIKKFASLSPYAGQHKFVIIDDAHLMTVEAQNSLLKILEEPSASTTLVLITAQPEILLPTIISRCQGIDFFAHKNKQAAAVLAEAELSKADEEFLAEFAGGRIGLVKKIIDNQLFDEVEAAVKKIMHLAKADIGERLDAAQKLTDEKNKAELPRLVLYWILYLRTRLDEPKAQKMLRGLLALNEIVNKPQYNQRLALENFLVSL